MPKLVADGITVEITVLKRRYQQYHLQLVLLLTVVIVIKLNVANKLVVDGLVVLVYHR
jgi:hypothetical protein